MEQSGAVRTPPQPLIGVIGTPDDPGVDGPLDAPPALSEAEPLSSRRHVRTQAGGKGAIVVAVLASLMWLIVNSQALMTLAMGLLFALVVDGWLARGALPTTPPRLVPVGEAAAGQPSNWRLELDRVRRAVTVRASGLRREQPLLVDTVDPGTITLPATGRGVIHAVHLDVVASGPIGLCRAGRRYRVVPTRPRVVGPGSSAEDVRWPPPAGLSLDLTEPTPRGDDQFRGVRPYQRGDERRKVHWKATARAGETMVREDDGTGYVALQVTVDLGNDDRLTDAEADAVVAHAARVVEEGRRQGWTVQLVTFDETPAPPADVPLGSPWRTLPPRATAPKRRAEGRTVAQVVASREVERRQLATAASGHPAAPPWRGLRCRVSSEGLAWS